MKKIFTLDPVNPHLGIPITNIHQVQFF